MDAARLSAACFRRQSRAYSGETGEMPMNRIVTTALCALLLGGCVPTSLETAQAQLALGAMERAASNAAAVADPRRLPEEVARDPLRKPAEMLEAMRLHEGAVIADIRPEEGYFTRLFAPAVGP